MTPPSQLLAVAASSLLQGYLAAIGKSIRTGYAVNDRVSWGQDTAFLEAFFRAQNQVGPAIYILWIADHINLLSLGYVSPKFRQLARQFKFFADDSFGGLVMRRTIHSLGADILSISQADPARRLELLRSVITTRPSVFLAVDGRGPYFRIGTGIVNLAIATRSTIVPCSILARPAISLTNCSVRVSLPVPKSRLLISLGTPISQGDLRTSGGAAAVARKLECDLQDIRTSARRFLIQA